MKQRVQFTINGEKVEVFAEPRKTLLQVIRNELGLTGTKEGCGMGECGVCSVLMDGIPVYSCLILAIEVDGRDILTVEGIKKGDKLHPLQKSFRDHGAVQCGFCTPAMLLTAKALLKENPRPTLEEVRTAISGNICRCTGYVKIVKAIKEASETIKKGDERCQITR